LGHWILKFGISLDFGAWNFRFLNTSIPGIVSLEITFLLGIVPLSIVQAVKGFSFQNVESRLGGKSVNLGNGKKFPAWQEIGSSNTGN